jgi:hypothetical protein
MLGGLSIQKSDHRHRGLLRARDERPGDGHAAKQSDERAPMRPMERHLILTGRDCGPTNIDQAKRNPQYRL